MGILRLFLALAVVLEHVAAPVGLRPLRGVEAVETFFMISGFYMAMILTEKYRGPGSHKLFWENRALRIYPVYWTVALLTALLWAASNRRFDDGSPLSVFKQLDGIGAWLVTLANFLIFGQDAIMFTGGNPTGQLFFTPDFRTAPKQVWTFLLVPPAWSLSLELLFYVLAPFLVRRRLSVLAVIVGLSFALRAYLFFTVGYRNDPWTYRFFPTEIGFFLVGALAYRFYLRLQTWSFPRGFLTGWALAFYLFLCLHQFLPEAAIKGVAAKPWIFFVFAWLSIPLLFLRSKHSSLDRYIGELSYPLYIVHWTVITCVAILLSKLGLTHGRVGATVAVSLLASVVLVHGVSNPIESVRRALAMRLQARRPPSPGLNPVASGTEA